MSERQYKALAKIYRKSIPNLWYRLGQSPFLVIGSVVKILPQNSQVTLKSGINVIKKLDYKKETIFLSVESDMEYRVRLRSCAKEPDTIEWIENFISEGDVLYDVGANTGAYSLVASKYFKGKIQVYSFEPSFLNFPQLCKNLALNHCEGSITPFQVALSEDTGVNTFNYHNLISGGAVHTLGEAIDDQGQPFTPASRQPVLSFRTDDFIKQFQIPPPNHIKIDVDGTEFSVLKGLDGTLNGAGVETVMLELNAGRGHKEQIIGYLRDKGFEIRSTYGANHLFARDAH